MNSEKRESQSVGATLRSAKNHGSTPRAAEIHRSQTLKLNQAREKLEERKKKKRRRRTLSPREVKEVSAKVLETREKNRNAAAGKINRGNLAKTLKDTVLAGDTLDVDELFKIDSPFFETLDKTEEVQKVISEAEGRLQRFKEAFKVHQEASVSRHADKLRLELKHINANLEAERAERSDVKSKLQELREAQKKNIDANERMLSDVWEIERNYEVEKIAKLRIELQDLERRKQTVETLYESRAVELTCIADEKEKRAQTNEQLLQSLLQRAEHLREELNNGLYDKQTRQAFAKSILDDEGDRENTFQVSKDRFNLAKAVSAARKNRFEEEACKRTERIRELNEKRFAIDEKLKTIAKKKREHDYLTSKGPDFLVELELGNTPPMEYILKNMGDGDDESLDILNLLDDGLDMEDFLKSVKERIVEREVALAGLRQKSIDKESRDEESRKMDTEDDGNEAYDGSLGAAFYTSDRLPAFIICRSIILKTVDDFLDSSYFNLDAQLKDAKAEYQKWEASRKCFALEWMSADLKRY